MAVDLLAELEAQIAAAEDTLVRLRNARAALANHRSGTNTSPVITGPALEGLPITQAIRQVLQYHAERGRDLLTVGEVFDTLRPFTIGLALGKSLWSSRNPWKVFAIAVTAPDNLAKWWHVEKSIPGKRAKLLKSDVIRLKPLQKSAK